MFVYLIWQTRKKIFRTLKISIFNISKYYKKDTKGVKIVFMLNFPPNVFMLNKKKKLYVQQFEESRYSPEITGLKIIA